MVSATAVVTDTDTLVTLKFPKELGTAFKKDEKLEAYLTDIMFDALLDYKEAKQDEELRKSLENDEEFHDLNRKLDKILGDL